MSYDCKRKRDSTTCNLNANLIVKSILRAKQIIVRILAHVFVRIAV